MPIFRPPQQPFLEGGAPWVPDRQKTAEIAPRFVTLSSPAATAITATGFVPRVTVTFP